MNKETMFCIVDCCIEGCLPFHNMFSYVKRFLSRLTNTGKTTITNKAASDNDTDISIGTRCSPGQSDISHGLSVAPLRLDMETQA